MNEIKKQVENLSVEDIYSCLKDEESKRLFIKFYHSKVSESDEFIINEAIQIYAHTDNVELKVRILELLKNSDF